MKKYDNFVNCLEILKTADFDMAEENEIYRMGIVGQFNLSFELAWKAIQETLRLHSVSGAESGSTLEIIKLAYANGFIDDAAVWQVMLKKRNSSTHVYDEDEVEELMVLIKDSFISTFEKLSVTLKSKIKETEEDNWGYISK